MKATYVVMHVMPGGMGMPHTVLFPSHGEQHEFNSLEAATQKAIDLSSKTGSVYGVFKSVAYYKRPAPAVMMVEPEEE